MKKILIVLIVALMAVLGTTQAQAWNLSTVSQQPVLGVSIGDQLLFDIVFTADTAGNTLGNYAFNFFYDDLELTWDISNSTFTPPTGLQPLGSTFENPTGQINNISGTIPLGGSAVSVSASNTLATLAFTVDSSVNIVPDGNADLWFDTTTQGPAFNVDGTNYWMNQGNSPSVPISGATIDIAVAPEPVSSALFVIGGVTLGFRRFVRRKK